MENILNLKKENTEKKEEKKEKIAEKMEWVAPEFEYFNKDKNWILIMFIIAAPIFVWSLISKSFLFSLLIILSCFTISVYAFKKPEEVKIAIDHRGIKINNTLYEFGNLKSFWIFYEPPHIKELSIRSKKSVMPYIKIPIGEENPVEIRNFLFEYLPEKKHKESLTDNLARLFRF